MSASRRCCRRNFNLLKIDPYTGAIVWKTLVFGDGNAARPLLYRVAPLHGTNDVICGIYAGYAYPASAQQICRVDSTGSQQWYRYAFAGVNTPSGYRPFGVDGNGVVICNTITGSPGGPWAVGTICGINPDNSLRWTISATTGKTGNANVAAWSSSAIVSYPVTSLPFPAAPYPDTLRINSLTGASVWTASTVVFGPIQAPDLKAADYSGNFMDADSNSTSPYSNMRSGSSGAITSSLTYRPANAQFGPGNYALASLAGAAVANSSGVVSWSLSSIGGNSLTAYGLYDATSDIEYSSLGYYFVGHASGVHDFHIFKTDASGSLIWKQAWPGAIGAMPYGCCISDDGYLYVSGDWSFG